MREGEGERGEGNEGGGGEIERQTTHWPIDRQGKRQTETEKHK